jgi:hypothetical protein
VIVISSPSRRGQRRGRCRISGLKNGVAVIIGFLKEGRHPGGFGTRDGVLAFDFREGNQARIAKCCCSFGLHSLQSLSAPAPSCCGPYTDLICPRCSEARSPPVEPLRGNDCPNLSDLNPLGFGLEPIIDSGFTTNTHLTTRKFRETPTGLRPDLRMHRFDANDIDAQCPSFARGRLDPGKWPCRKGSATSTRQRPDAPSDLRHSRIGTCGQYVILQVY